MPITNTTWAKGQSGNPGGRPRILEAVRDIARESTTLAIETLRTIAADADAPQLLFRWRQKERSWSGRRTAVHEVGKEILQVDGIGCEFQALNFTHYKSWLNFLKTE